MEICAYFFFLFPIVLFVTKALEFSCLWFTEKKEDYSNTSMGRHNQDLHRKRIYCSHISCLRTSSSSRFAFSALPTIPLVAILSVNLFSIFTQLLFYCCSQLDLYCFFPPDEKVHCLSFPGEHGFEISILEESHNPNRCTWTGRN